MKKNTTVFNFDENTVSQKINSKEFLFSPKSQTVNIYYLKDKIIEGKILHEKYEALSFMIQQYHHPYFEAMMKQFLEKLFFVLDSFKFETLLLDVVHFISIQPYKLIIDLALLKF